MKELKIQSQREHVAVTEPVRKAIDQFLNDRTKEIDWEKDPLTKTVGKVKQGQAVWA